MDALSAVLIFGFLVSSIARPTSRLSSDRISRQIDRVRTAISRQPLPHNERTFDAYKPAGTIKPFPPETVFLFLGSEASYIQTQGRWPIVNDKGQVLLTADFEEKGLSVTTQLYDEQGNLQATVDNNDVDVLSADICVRRPDLSTLIISDRSTKQERLYVHYLNPRAVEFRGLLRYPNLPDVAITKEAIKYEQVSVTRSCLPAASPDGMIMIY